MIHLIWATDFFIIFIFFYECISIYLHFDVVLHLFYKLIWLNRVRIATPNCCNWLPGLTVSCRLIMECLSLIRLNIHRMIPVHLGCVMLCNFFHALVMV